MTERVTLVVGEDRIEASRKDLISKSEYFASLFSPNFRDSLSDEHRINYDINTKTLRTFVSWTSDHTTSSVGDYRRVKHSLEKYIGDSGDFNDLLQLLQMSVLFVAELLIKDLTDLIACHWLIPEKSVQVWVLAKELGLKTLCDLAKVVCIDRFHDLPDSSLLELPGQDFIDIVGNVHIKANPNYLLGLAKEWIVCNVTVGETNTFQSSYPFTLMEVNAIWSMDFERKYEKQQCERNIQCIVGHKRTDDNKNKMCIYCWDGTDFFEIIELPTSPTVSNNSIVGIQALGRGYDIYLMGGEYGYNTGHFQMEIWRYSMISKTWYYVTRLPRPRRHMAAAFLKEKLVLVGGMEKIHRSRSTVDIYNIYTGEWCKGPTAGEEFTNTSLSYADDTTLTLYGNRGVYSFYLDKNLWEAYYGVFLGILYNENGDLLDTEDIPAQFLMSYSNIIYVLDSDDFRPSRIWGLEDYEHFESRLVGNCLTKFDNQVSNGPYLIGFSHKDSTICVELVKIINCDTMETKIVYKEEKSNLLDLCTEDPIGCFNIFNPDSLNDLFVFNNEEEKPEPGT